MKLDKSTQPSKGCICHKLNHREQIGEEFRKLLCEKEMLISYLDELQPRPCHKCTKFQVCTNWQHRWDTCDKWDG